MSASRQPITLSQAETALYFIPSGCDRETWAMIAAALHSEFGECAFDVFERWSATGQNFNPRDCKSTWKSVAKLTQIGIGTLLFLAKQHGWQAAPARTITEGEQQKIHADAVARAIEATERARIAAIDTQRLQAEAQAKAERIWGTRKPRTPPACLRGEEGDSRSRATAVMRCAHRADA